jgi:glycine/D-amino acid oxidase-like deaminating enzyme
MVRESGEKRAAVVGCGVVGLATARLLQQMGLDVAIYAKAFPPDTTSNVAGGLWEPFSVFDADQTTTAFQQQFNDAVQFSYRYFQGFAGEDYGVRWMPTYVLSQRPFQAGSAADVSSALRAFHPELHDLSPGEHRFPVPHARRFHAMLIEPHPYLRALIRDFRVAGGRIIVREFREVAELITLPEPVIVNCTGLGARQLFGDEQLIPIKGQLTFLLPQPEVDYVVVTDGLYMFPRRDGILLGGTFVRNDWTLEPDPVAKARILTGHADLFRKL